MGSLLARLRAIQTVDLVEAAVFDSFDFAVKFHYFDGLADVIKAHCRNQEKRWVATYFGRKDHRFHRYWKIHRAVIDESSWELYCALEALGKRSGVDVENYASFERKFIDARANIDPSAFVDDLRETIYPLKRGGAALLGTYHPGVAALVKTMGGSYLSAMRAWKLQNTSPIALKNNLITEFALRDDQVEVLDFEYDLCGDAILKADTERPSIRTANNLAPDLSNSDELGEHEVYLAVTSPLAPTPFGATDIASGMARYSLYDYQQDGFRHLVTKTSALLADDMGLGKTRQAVAAADFLAQGGKILIACPASLVINWVREIRMVVPGAAIAQQCFDPDAQWIVTNYERLEELLPHAAAFRVMITDEAHLLKEATTKRTRLAFDVASKVPYRFILTGTPILNRESEIHTLLRLSGHPIGDIPLRQFEEEFAGDPSFRLELNKRIREWMLRRKKDVVLKSLKGKQHQVVYITPSSERVQEYKALANNPELLALPKIQKLRTLLEQIKLESVIEMVRDLQADDKVLVFCEFKESVRALKAMLAEHGIESVTMDGDDSNTRRQKTVDRFQEDPDVRVFIGTTQAAGVGINLTAANYVIFASLPWTPALKDQAEDRAYRNGQQRLVIVKIPLMENTIDADLWEMLIHKKGIATEILNPEEAEAQAMQALAVNLTSASKTLPTSTSVGLPITSNIN